MILGAELINDNGISTVALGFFTALFTALGAAVVGIYQIKAKANEAKDAAVLAKEEASQTASNTKNVANGFAGRMDRKLDTVIENQNDLAKALRDHLEWHLDNSQEKK